MSEELKPFVRKEGCYQELCYNDALSARLEKLVNNKLLSDVSFIVGPEQQRIYAHKLHLLEASEYFAKMFNGDFVEARQNEVVLPDVDPEVFIEILRLVYCKKVKLNWDNFRDIYNCLQKFLLVDYFDPLIHFLHDEVVDKDTAMKIFLENDDFNFEKVDEKCMHYITNNPLYFFGKEEFTSFPVGRLSKILETGRINCTNDQLKEAVEKWLSANPQSDEETLRKLLTETRRSFYSHKLHLLHRKLENVRSGTISFRLTSGKPLSCYGLGVYVTSTDVPISGSVSMTKVHYGTPISTAVKFITTLSPGCQILDIMFKELLLEPETDYKLEIELEKSVLKTSESSVQLNSEIDHENIKITFWGNGSKYRIPYIAYLWTKYPDCVITNEGGSQVCCKTKFQ